MYRLLEIGDTTNIPTHSYYVESEEDVEKIKNAPIGSTVMILTEGGLTIKMLRSTGWVSI